MRSASRYTPTHGFSLIELSIVIAILSVVVTFGLTAAASYMNQGAVDLTRTKLAVVDKAIVNFFAVYGRLPCPAVRTTAPTTTTYGLEDCTITILDSGTANQVGGGVMSGAVPFRALNLPMSASFDGFYSKINYVVTKNLTVAGLTTGRFGYYSGTDATTLSQSGIGGIEIRSGILEQPCSTTNCQVVASPTSTVYPTTATTANGAAYILFSSGPDRRGAISLMGTTLATCAPAAGDARTDTQNCVQGTNGVRTNMSVTTIPYNAFYDNRYNAGLNLRNYFDDLVIWRTKGQL